MTIYGILLALPNYLHYSLQTYIGVQCALCNVHSMCSYLSRAGNAEKYWQTFLTKNFSMTILSCTQKFLYVDTL
jgi:hypothetical protein